MNPWLQIVLSALAVAHVARAGEGAKLYPVPSLAQKSDRFAVTVAGQSLVVERLQDVSYGRFAMADKVPVEIQFRGAVRSVRVLPVSAAEGLSFEGHTIRFALLRPSNVAILVNLDQRLFLFADPPESDRPMPGPGVTNVLDYGVDPTGARLSTPGIQKAIDDAARVRGTVLFPEGTFLTGTVTVRSHVTLYLSPGATIQGSRDPADYPRDPGRHETGSDTSIVSADQRYRGETMTFSRLILFDGAEDAHLVGRGTIQGEGRFLRQERNAVPNLIRVRGGKSITIRDVLLRDSAAWTLHLLATRNVAIQNVKILNDRSNLNTDGVDVDSSQEVAIRGSFIYTKDDAICVKATNNSGLLADVSRIEATGNVLSSADAALKVGTESKAARFDQITFQNNDVFDSDRAMSVVVRDGALYSNIAFRDIRVGPRVEHLIAQVIGLRAGNTKTLGRIERLSFENIDAPFYERPARNSTWYAQFRPGAGQSADVPVFEGADAAHEVRGLHLHDVVVNGIPLTDPGTAAKAANLTIGPFVEDVSFE